MVETHVSVLVFLGDRVYKLRKPVHFGFVDFTDREARRTDCHREVELNRRLAPDVYLGVADVVMDGEPIDHLVVMRALPEDRRLAALVRSGGDVAGWIEQVATAVAAFHASALRSDAIAASAAPEAIGREWQQNFAEVDRFVGSVLDPVADGQIRQLVDQWLGHHRELLEVRVAEGRACDGHGDLQAEDIFCLDDGVRILDCLEFSDELRFGDVCSDVAFLAMDLERLGRADLATRFVSEYEARSGTPIPASLLHLYVAERAYVRTKVACLRAEQSVQGRADAADSARALHALALRHLRRARPVLVLVGGLPGAGKSTLATGLAAATGWALERSDEIRSAAIAGGDRYSPEAVAAVYEHLVSRARAHLALGRSVVLDASWVWGRWRRAAAEAAAETGSALVEVCCTCDDDVAAVRIAERARRGDDTSEATVAVRDLLAARLESWPSAATIDTSSGGPGAAVGAVLRLVEAEPGLPGTFGPTPSGSLPTG